MEPNQVAGIAGGIIGGLLGTLGGAVGTYFSIKNTNGPKERAFVIRCSVICWLILVGVLTLFFLLPSSWKGWLLLLWIPYGFLFPLSIRKWNKEQTRLRSEEAEHPSANAAK